LTFSARYLFLLLSHDFENSTVEPCSSASPSLIEVTWQKTSFPQGSHKAAQCGLGFGVLLIVVDALDRRRRRLCVFFAARL